MFTSRARRAAPLALVPLAPILLAAALSALLAAAAAAGAGQTSTDQVEAQLARGHQALRGNDLVAALAAFKTADRLAGGRSAAALEGMAAVHYRAGRLSDCVKAARRGREVAATPEERARLDNQLGLALYALARPEHDAKGLDEAIASFRSALDLTGGSANSVRFNLGIALLARSRDAEGTAMLKTFLETQPEGADTRDARRFIADPRRARDTFAPEFAVSALDGRQVSLDGLHGKAVLLDFWATWCAPCRDSAPSIERLAERLKDKPFVLLGVSIDSDEAKLRSYLAGRTAVHWPQAWDHDGALKKLFHVGAVPTFIVLDGDGRIVFTIDGWGSNRERQLTSAVDRTLDQLARAPGGS